MKRMHHRPLRLTAVLLAVTTVFTGMLPAKDASNVLLWDTGSPLSATPQSVDSQWRQVPAEIFSLEKDPLKAASDPGYYGREYSFGGDAVVANASLAAVFQSRSGTVTLYAKNVLGASAEAGQADGFGRRIAELIPLTAGTSAPAIADIEVVRNFADEVALEVAFANNGDGGTTALFVFDRTGTVDVRPRGSLKGFSVHGTFEHAIVPSFVGDDLIYPAGRSSTASVALPAENALIGLLSGGDAELVMTWPAGRQRVKLQAADAVGEPRRFQSIDFEADGEGFFLTALHAPGIWHREKLGVAYLERDVVSGWRRPFPAKWQTQLLESKVRTTYAFRNVKGEIWRGVPGSYIYPVWFDGNDAHFQLSKKIPPKGEALIYFLEGRGTPAPISTPADILKSTLGRSAAAALLDLEGRKLRTHHRRAADALTHRACTCGYTEAIQALFEEKCEVSRRDDVAGSLDDMIYFVKSHVERIDEYRQFAGEMSSYLKIKADALASLRPCLEKLSRIVAQIPEEYEVQKENMRSMEYAAELAERTMALTDRQETGNLGAYMDLLKAWRAMGGAQDYVVARYHMIARQLAQEAGYGCVDDSAAVDVAMEIRSRCRRILRNADGYEIWSNY